MLVPASRGLRGGKVATMTLRFLNWDVDAVTTSDSRMRTDALEHAGY